MFTLDHYNYVRWLSVFICDLKQLPVQNKDLLEMFKEGFFTVKKTNHAFSNISPDQAYEQNNKHVKSDGGVIGILDNPVALLKWVVAGSAITRILNSMNHVDTEDKESPHHEDTVIFEEQFRQDAEKFYITLKEVENPFEEQEKGLLNLETRNILPKKAYDVGNQQYQEYFMERLVKVQNLSMITSS